MVFSSHIFVFYFLPLVLAVYYLLPARLRHLALTLFSYFFYGWTNLYFAPLMLFSTLADYCAGRFIVSRAHLRTADAAHTAASGSTADGAGDERGMAASQPDPPDERQAASPIDTPGRPTASTRRLDAGSPRNRRQKAAVALSVIVNLGLLGFFKYFNFGVDSYNAFLSGLGLESWRWDTVLRVTLPLGISFYTFQSISYTVDVYRGRAAAVRNFIDFACYVSLFPQLVAGPIIRFHEISRQLRRRTHTLDKFARGVAFFSLGMAKKILLANPCGRVADLCFDAGSRAWTEAWYGLAAYAFQIYFDFSGYSDMAVGLGLMLGFVFPRNFNHPYRSRSITEVWRRWHMSLSRWLRDYLYIPLGGSRRGPVRTYVNLAAVMLLGGLWHGAEWTFVIWGGFHGLLLMAEKAAWRRSTPSSEANSQVPREGEPRRGLKREEVDGTLPHLEATRAASRSSKHDTLENPRTNHTPSTEPSSSGPESLYRWMPGPLRTAFIFLLMCLSWVPFRAADASSALSYLTDLLALRTPQPGAALLPGTVYQPYYLLSLAVAAWLVWRGRDTWEYTRSLPLAKAAWCLILLTASLIAMTAQSYNPFIYFIF